MHHSRIARRRRATPLTTTIATALALVFAVSATAATAQAKEKDFRQPIDHELEKYWNVELAVPTLTNPAYTHKGALEGTIGIGLVPNDSYYLPLPITLRGTYHMTESLALELSGSYLGLGANSDLHAFLLDANGINLLDGARNPAQMWMSAAIDLMYSPFHGKLGVFDQKISSFDIALVAGAGMIAANIDETPENAKDELTSTFLPAGHWGVTLRFFLKEWLTVRADYRQFVYKPYDSALFPVEMTVGVSFFSK